MAKLSTKDISATITGGYVHIILPDNSSPTGFTSKRIKLEDFISAGGGTWGSITGTLSDQTDLWEILETIPEAQIQSDWDQADNQELDFIKNKPTIPAEITEITDIPTTETDDSLVLAPNGLGGVEWRAESGGGAWGGITGTLSDQTDLQNALNAKANLSLAGYDATIGAGGDYATLNAAIAAGKNRLIVVGETTLNANITLNSKLLINLNGNLLNFSSYNIVYSAGAYLSIYDLKKSGTIYFAYSSAKVLFFGFSETTLFVDGIEITNASTANACQVANQGTFEFCRITLPNYHSCCFGASGSDFQGNIIDCSIIGAGTSCYNVIYCVGVADVNIVNLTLSGTYSTTQTIIYAIYEKITINRLLYSSATAGKMSISNANAIIDIASKLTIDLVTGYLINSHVSVLNMRANTVAINNVIYSNCAILSANTVSSIRCLSNKFNGTFTYTAVTGVNNVFENNLIAGASSITGTFIKFLSNICTGAVTLNAGTGESDFLFNTFTGGITDSSGLLTNNILYNH